MDGIKGSSRKGTRALDRLAVVWKAYNPSPGIGKGEEEIHEPGLNSPVPEMSAADWKGGNHTDPTEGKDLGLRTESPASANVSKASSIKSVDRVNQRSEEEAEVGREGVKPSGPGGDDLDDVDVRNLPQASGSASEPALEAVNKGLDTASATTVERGTTQSPSSTNSTDDSTLSRETHNLHLNTNTNAGTSSRGN